MSVRLNNAGNLTYSKYNNWNGQLGKHGRFVVFDSKENGLRAMNTVTKSNIRKTKYVSAFVGRYVNESSNKEHIRKYKSQIRKYLGRERMYESDSETLLPLIVFLEGGQSAYKYFFGENYVRTNNARFNHFIQVSLVKNGLYRRSVKQTKCYSLRDVLMASKE